MRGRYQGGDKGSLAGFIIVGVLLALVLVGGIYGLNRYNAQKASNEVATSDKSDKNTADLPKDTDKTTNDDQKKSSTGSSSSSSQNAKSDDTKSTATSGAANQNSQSAVLPHTGPSDVVTGMVTLALLTFAAAHFVQGRRALS